MNKYIVIGIVILVLGGLGWWGVKSMTDLPGVAVADQGRDHKSREENDKFTYDSSPPTSGPHDPDWIRSGVYDTPQDKYKLIHSLEHGYVVVHYNCEKLGVSSWELVVSVKAHEDEPATSSGQATDSAKLTGVWDLVNCQELKKTLTDFKDKLGLKRVIVNPNSEIDKPVILVAWRRILKMDKWSETEAAKFAKAFHNKGPEQTME